MACPRTFAYSASDSRAAGENASVGSYGEAEETA